MKKKYIVIFLLFISLFVSAQENSAIKAKLYGGYILPTSNITIDYLPSAGLELAFECVPSGEYAWKERWGFPSVGVALLGINLGNVQELGQVIALYPYVSWGLYSANSLKLSAKVGAGLAGFTKLSAYTATYMSGFLSTGLSFEYTPKSRGRFSSQSQYSYVAEVGTNHISNIDFRVPSSTINIAYLTLGAKYRFDKYESQQRRNYFKETPYEVMVNLTLCGGQKGYRFVDKKAATCASFHTDFLFKINELYTTGVGGDAFFNNSFVRQGYNGSVNHNDLVYSSDYFIAENSLSNFFRAGITWSNLFTAGRLSVIFDWGIYVYDPIKSAYSNANNARRRTFFYLYNPVKEDGWNYFRAGARYRLLDNVYAQVSVKTHILRMEFLEFGIGYAIPMRRNVHYNKKTGKFNNIEIWHPDSDKFKTPGSRNRGPGGAGYRPR